MKKTISLLLFTLLLSSTAFAAKTNGPFGYNLEDDINRKPAAAAAPPSQPAAPTQNTQKPVETGPVFYADDKTPEWMLEKAYYSSATISSAVAKYKKGNYSGCLQEMISISKKDTSNPVVYYYMGMSYTQIGNKTQAIKAYEKVMKLNSDRTLVNYATRGRDCLVGGGVCKTGEGTEDQLDKFIKSPYGNGFSKELNTEFKQQQLKNIQKTINNKNELDNKDIERIKNIDNNKTESIDNTKIAGDVSNDDVLKALDVLKKAGVNVSVNPYQATMPQNNQYAEMSMMLGNNNNNNSSMMNMLPYMMNQNNNGQNVNPQMIQAMMMNSMIPDFTFNDDNNKKY